MEKLLTRPIQYLKGIGPRRAKSFDQAGIHTIEDLLYYFPRRYEDRTSLKRISELIEGQVQTIKAEVMAQGQRRAFRRGGLNIIEVVVADESGKIFCVWFNQPYLAQYFKVGTQLILYGKVERYGNRLQMSAPEFEIILDNNGDSLNTGRIVPVYSLPSLISQRVMRQVIKRALDEYVTSVNDLLPYDLRMRHNLLNVAKSLINIHFPENYEAQKQAYERLSFEEFFLFQIPLALRKLKKKEKAGIAHKAEGRLLDKFISTLTFTLTNSQQKVINEIKADMALPRPMQRLLQGDVGSGKTVVATAACLMCIQGRYQAAFMAPTEILAKQHYNKISSEFIAHSSLTKQVKIGLLTGSLDKKKKEKIYRQIKEGEIDLIIGTHALLTETVEFKKLGLVVIDEQHKFGVGQRALLPQKGVTPDVLIMTATPIPRTLAITLYGDLDVSVITELPPGRLPVRTLDFSQGQATKAYEIALKELAEGSQVYIIYPVIEESFALDIAGAKKMYGQLKQGLFKEYRLGLIHGRLKEEEQDEVMRKFKEKKVDLLVATTVLEVGIDIPNATCMIIEHAERFGLSQLHQLRGRVGRGTKDSFCLLISSAKTQEAKERMEAMVKYSDGFHIAEEDLKIRGPGEFFGSRQHGLTELRVGNPFTQMQLLRNARDEAIKLVNLDGRFIQRQNMLIKEKLLQRFPEYETLMLVG